MFGTGNVVFAFDSKTSKRKKLFPGYKQKRHTKDLTDEERAALDEFRVQMRSLRRKILPALGFGNIFQVKGLEADDIIAAWCRAVYDREMTRLSSLQTTTSTS